MSEEQRELIEKVEELYTKASIQETRFNLVEVKIKSAEVDLQSYIKRYFDDLLIGSVTAFAMKKAPKGWLVCDGSEVSRVQYQKLFTRIGITFGDGNGETTFNLPDLRGEFIRGFDSEGNTDPDRKLGSKQTDQIQSHIHMDSGHSHFGSVDKNGKHTHDNSVASNEGMHDHTGQVINSGEHHHNATIHKGGKHKHNLRRGYGTCRGGNELGLIYGDFSSKEHELYYLSDDFCSASSSEHTHTVSISSSGLHQHSLNINESGGHLHRLSIKEDGIHSHQIHIEESSSPLGYPVNSDNDPIRHGDETRPRNLALLYCIKC